MIYEEKTIELDAPRLSVPRTEHVPKLKLLIPNAEEGIAQYTPSRPTVLILPGGGYAYTSEREAEPIAMHFLTRGMNAAILYYSCKPAVFPLSLLEALSALRIVRETAAQYHGDPHKIFVCGFSAGGHLAASVAALWNGAEARAYFGDVSDLRPDGLILAYPVICSGYDGETRIHKGSFDNLLGARREDAEMLRYLSLDTQVTHDMPPTFLWSTFEDKLVPCENTLRFAAALRRCGVPFELHIYEKGGHGSATGDRITLTKELRLKNWLNEVCAWIEDDRAGCWDEE